MRETVGWKYQSKPPPPGPNGEVVEKPSAARKIGMLCREFFVAKKLYEPAPSAPGFPATWHMQKQRIGLS